MTRPPASGGPFREMCSWCHGQVTMGPIVRGVAIVSPTLCPSCGHRADVCRSECNCLKCLTGPQSLTDAEVDKMMEWLRKTEERRT
jgi:hypothetical protein